MGLSVSQDRSRSMDALAESLAASPELFPHTLDVQRDAIGFIRLDRAAYKSASFLDERVLTAQTLRRAVAWPEVRQAVAETDLVERCDFIFHIGHVGSTLLSRLLGEHPTTLALREPAVLRTMAQIRAEPEFEHQTWGNDGFDARLSALLKLWSRTFALENRTVLKTTSFVSEMAAELMARPHCPRAILMFVSPENYLATILGGANAPQETKALAPGRLKRLQRRLGRDIEPPSPNSIGEAVAMSWACEMTALVDARQVGGERALLLNFDTFLAQSRSTLKQCFHHLGIAATETDAQAILDGPHMRQYSKAPEHAYDANLRRAVLDQARAISNIEIGRGLAWLDRMVRDHTAITEAVTLTM
jgi:hypothetical protein